MSAPVTSGVPGNIADDLAAIAKYINDRNSAAQKYPALATIIPEFRRWYADLGWYTRNWDKSSLDTARKYRDQVDQVMGVTPVPWLPSDKEKGKPAPSSGPSLTGLYVGLGAVALGLVTVTVLQIRR